MFKVLAALIALITIANVVLTPCLSQPYRGSTAAERSVASKIKSAGDTAEAKIDELSAQLNKVLDVLVERYKAIKPKLKKIKKMLISKKKEIDKINMEE